MRTRFAWGLVATLGAMGWMAACAASSEEDDGGGSGASTANGGSGGIDPVGPGSGGSGGDFQQCAKFTDEASQKPAAMLVVLDMSASMGTAGKYQAAQLAIVSAIDQDVFDTMHLGLVTFPSSYTPPPECICTQLGAMDPATCLQIWQAFYMTPGVSCGVSALPQIPLAFAGTDKSNAGMGVRSQIYQFLANENPQSTSDDGSPVYEAMLAGYNALKFYSGVDERMLVLITDGGFSCTSVAAEQRDAFLDNNGCADWEHPDNVNEMIQEHRNDPEKPVSTFIIGVPGSDTNGGSTGGFDNPPYSMLLALSTYAVSGSPDTQDPSCDASAVFTQQGAAPANPCHFDLSQGQLDAGALAQAIAAIRGKALGCIYQLPEPPPGETIDLNLVNVEVTLDGNAFTLPKRSDPGDDCAADGCWDYTATNEVQILGKTCDDLSTATEAKVEIVVGCATILK